MNADLLCFQRNSEASQQYQTTTMSTLKLALLALLVELALAVEVRIFYVVRFRNPSTTRYENKLRSSAQLDEDRVAIFVTEYENWSGGRFFARINHAEQLLIKNHHISDTREDARRVLDEMKRITIQHS